jgi:hypothetical protein
VLGAADGGLREQRGHVTRARRLCFIDVL